MTIHPLPAVTEVLRKFEQRSEAFECGELAGALDKAVDIKTLTPAERKSWWAEDAAFTFDADEGADAPAWDAHFQPMLSKNRPDGTSMYCPDIKQVDSEVMDYWRKRAKEATHPTMAARYADLVWDFGTIVGDARKGTDVEFAKLAIDSYVAASKIDSGSAWGDTEQNLRRAMTLSLKIKDKQRAKLVVDAILEYEKKTANDEEPGTFSFAFGVLLPDKGGPKLDPGIEKAVVESLEARFAAMVAPGSEWDASPKSSERVAGDLLNYYRRKGLNNKSKQVLAALARQHVRRAAMGDALSAMIFLNDARKLFLQAGMKEEAEKTQLQSQTLGPAAEEEMKRVTVKLEIKKEDIDQYLASLSADGVETGVAKWVDDFLPRPSDIERLEREAARTAPLQSILHDSAKILGEGHVNADVGNETGDADGKAVHKISRFMNSQAPFLSLGLDHLLSSGMNWDALKTLLSSNPLVAEDRLSIIKRGFEAHVQRDYVLSIHLLIPQIEAALKRLLPLLGRTNNKGHRTGRGEVQFKNLNDMLNVNEWPVGDEAGENLRKYLLACLAHPKGLNIRNEVSHGNWSDDRFTKLASERVLHSFLAVVLMRHAGKSSEVGDADKIES